MDDAGMQQYRATAKDNPDLALLLEITDKFRERAAERGIPQTELMDEGWEPLVNAKKTFKEGDWKAYATTAVSRRLNAVIRGWELPPNTHKLYVRLEKAMTELRRRLRREPTDEDIASETNIRMDKVREWRLWQKEFKHVRRIDGPTGGGEDGQAGGIQVPDDEFPPDVKVGRRESAAIEREMLDSLLHEATKGSGKAKLGPEEEEVLRLRWGLDRELDLDKNERLCPRPRVEVARILAEERKRREYQLMRASGGRPAEYNRERVRLLERQAADKIARLLQKRPAAT